MEDTAGEVRYNLEIQNLEHAVKELRIKLAEKTSQIDSYDKVILLTRSPVLLFPFLLLILLVSLSTCSSCNCPMHGHASFCGLSFLFYTMCTVAVEDSEER